MTDKQTEKQQNIIQSTQLKRLKQSFAKEKSKYRNQLRFKCLIKG